MRPSGKERGVLAENSGKLLAIMICGFFGLSALASIAERIGADGTWLSGNLVGFVGVAALLLGLTARTTQPAYFFSAGREVPPVANALAAAGALPIATIATGIGAGVMGLGFDGTALLIGPLAGLVLASTLLVPHVAATRASTTAEFVGLRFGVVPRMLTALLVAAISFALLVATLSATTHVASFVFELPPHWIVGALLAVAVLIVLPGGLSGATWGGFGLAVIGIVALVMASTAIAFGKTGVPITPLAYGHTLADIAGLETSLLEKELADARTLKTFVRPFLTLDSVNYLALTLSLALGFAAFPHLSALAHRASGPRDARSAGVVVVALAAVTLIMSPALAAFARHEVLSSVDKAVALSDAPEWLEPFSRHDLARVHGVSSGLMSSVADAIADGASDTATITDFVSRRSLRQAEAWTSLKEAAKAEVVTAARTLPGRDSSSRWLHYRTALLPALAKVSGNKSGRLTLAALEIDPDALSAALPRVAGRSSATIAVAAAGLMATALAVVIATLFSAGTALGSDLYPSRVSEEGGSAWRTWTTRLALVLTAAGAGYLATGQNVDVSVLAQVALCLSAGALLPVLLLAVWWRRANAWGATAGLVTGATVALYYLISTRYFPVPFLDHWAGLSSGGPEAGKKAADLLAAWQAAPEAGKAAALAALERFTGGAGSVGVGAANWLGIWSAASAVFAAPAALVMGMLVSLFTPTPSVESQEVLSDMRRPEPPRKSELGVGGH